jgi:signal peptidase I
MSGARGYVFILAIVIACAFVVKSWFLDAIVIPSLSMEQTLLEGDYLLVNKFIYSDRPGSETSGGNAGFQPIPFHTVERGDVIVFRFPRVREMASNPDDSLSNGVRSGETILSSRAGTFSYRNAEIRSSSTALHTPDGNRSSKGKGIPHRPERTGKF